MPEKDLHIISFDIPYPPNYGGVIDVFHKIRALHDAGVRVHLHCFQYDRQHSPELEKYCNEVIYYPRKTGLLSALSWKPYIVFSRRSGLLVQNLCKDRYPILFEGLHTCYYLNSNKILDHQRIYRESNIEHQYYFHLFMAEKNPFKKVYFIFSSLKLRTFQKILRHSTLMLTVSIEDNDYLSSRFKDNPVKYLPSFHADDELKCLTGNGDYILYQGNLSVPENYKAAEYLITKVLKGTNHPFIIAGLDPPEKLNKLCSKYSNIQLIANPSEEEMTRLIRNAHINMMVTFQPTGLKLKLLNALFNGRFCLVNPEMVAGTELSGICEIGKTPEELRDKIEKLFALTFDDRMISYRQKILMKWHSNKENCKTLLNLLSLLCPE